MDKGQANTTVTLFPALSGAGMPAPQMHSIASSAVLHSWDPELLPHNCWSCTCAWLAQQLHPEPLVQQQLPLMQVTTLT